MGAFTNFWEKGYTRLLPVIPASQKHITNAGKRPGNKEKGYWEGTGSKIYDATQVSIMNWEAMGASVGLRTDGDIIGVDIDVLDHEWSEKIKKAAIKHLGPGALRIGRAPKALLMYRVTEPMNWRRVRFDAGTEEIGLVELLAGDTKWFVVDGIHPKTEAPYRWPNGVPNKSELPVVTPEQVTDFMNRLEAELPKAKGKLGTTTDRTQVDQDKIRALDLDKLQSAMEAIPNNPDETGYEGWVAMAAALRGACQDDPNLGLDLFLAYSEKGGVPEPTEDPERVFWSLDPPFAFGADYVFAHAKKAGWMDPDFLGDYSEEASTSDQPKSENSEADYFPVVDIDTLLNRAPPRMLIGRHYPEQSVGFLYGDPGTFKSFMALDQSLTLAAGMGEWQGDPITVDPDAVVVYLAGEGGFGIRNRVAAWCKARGVDPAQLQARFKMIEVSVDFMKAEDIQKLMRTIRKVIDARPCLMVVDTVSRSLPGAEENGQKDMTIFVHACTVMSKAFRCAVVGVHHANKQGSDMRGSTVLRGAGDFVFRMTRKPESDLVILACEKQKDTESGWKELYAVKSVDLGEGENSLVLDRIEKQIHETDMSPALAQRVLLAMKAAWDAGEPWAKAAQAKERWAVRRISVDFDVTAQAAEDAVKAWVQTGVISAETVDKKSKRVGYRVHVIPGQNVPDEDIFG